MKTTFAALALAVAAQSIAPRFESVQPELFGAGSTFTNAWADMDDDGALDLFVGFDGKPNRLYRNFRGTFVEIAGAAGIADARPTRAAAWGDYDADGDPDLFLGFAPGDSSVTRLYRNDGGPFTDVTARLGLTVQKAAVRQPAWVDFDGDGDLDLFIAFRDRANALYRNDVTQFVDVAPTVGIADTRRTVGAVWFDYDQDGDLDLAVANMDGDANGLYRNDAGTFTDVAVDAGVASGGRAAGDKTNGTVRVCAADVNNDGRFDLFAANYGKNGLLLNRPGGKFEDVSAAWQINIDARYDSCAFDDFDNDGRIDFYVNGTVTGGTSYPDYLFRNVGTRFENVTPENIKALHGDHGVQWADFDGDGDVDLALTGAQTNGMHLLLRNTLSEPARSRAIRVRALDAKGRATLAGGEVRVLSAGTQALLAARLIDAGSGYDSQNDMPVHVGLATAATVIVEVVYPRAGKRVSARSAAIKPSGQLVTVQLK